jgi:hypothetical protein
MLRPAFRTAISITIYGMTILAVIASIVAYKPGFDWTGLIVLSFVSVCWWSRSIWHRWIVRRQYTKCSEKDIEIEWQIMPDKLSVQSPLAHTECVWKVIVKVVHTPCGLMLYPQNNLFFYLPRRGFASDAEFEQAIELAKSNVPQFRCVT